MLKNVEAAIIEEVVNNCSVTDFISIQSVITGAILDLSSLQSSHPVLKNVKLQSMKKLLMFQYLTICSICNHWRNSMSVIIVKQI